MPRTIWKGSISFGLVNIPVALLPGEQREEMHLARLHSRDKAPVGVHQQEHRLRALVATKKQMT